MRYLTLLSLWLFLSACSTPAIEAPTVRIDTSPVGCGYKWFQSGVSPGIRQSCAAPRGEDLKRQQKELARAKAWEIARERCPDACPPRELHDPTQGEERNPDGSCRDGHLYYGAQVFFQCGT